jgi:hypothetical protein
MALPTAALAWDVALSAEPAFGVLAAWGPGGGLGGAGAGLGALAAVLGGVLGAVLGVTFSGPDIGRSSYDRPAGESTALRSGFDGHNGALDLGTIGSASLPLGASIAQRTTALKPVRRPMMRSRSPRDGAVGWPRYDRVTASHTQMRMPPRPSWS